MTHHTLNASVPQHAYGYVCSEILYGLDPSKVGQFEPCVIFGVTSIPSRALHFSILCESGAQWARIPIHMLRWDKPCKPPRPITELQCWDNHHWCFSTVHYEYLREMGCKYRTPSGELVDAFYWFTLDHTDNGFSQYPPEHKCYHRDAEAEMSRGNPLFKVRRPDGSIAVVSVDDFTAHYDEYTVLERISR